MSLPDELRVALRIKDLEDTVVFLTTASLEGLPNVSVQQFTDVQGDYVLLPDLFAQKTKVNLKETLRRFASAPGVTWLSRSRERGF
jgi:hypothetical protein